MTTKKQKNNRIATPPATGPTSAPAANEKTLTYAQWEQAAIWLRMFGGFAIYDAGAISRYVQLNRQVKGAIEIIAEAMERVRSEFPVDASQDDPAAIALQQQVQNAQIETLMQQELSIAISPLRMTDVISAKPVAGNEKADESALMLGNIATACELGLIQVE